MLSDTLPQWLEDGVKGFNTIGCSSFSKGSYSQGTDGPHLLLLIHKTCEITQSNNQYFNTFDSSYYDIIKINYELYVQVSLSGPKLRNY